MAEEPIDLPAELRLSDDTEPQVLTGTEFLSSIAEPKTQRPPLFIHENTEPLVLSDQAEAIIQDIACFAIACLLFFAMDLAVHQQYRQELTFKIALGHMINYAPGAALIVYLTNHIKKPWMRLQMFLGSVAAGSYLIWIANKGSYLTVIRQGPVLASLWIYLVIRSNLWDVLGALLFVFAFTKWKGLTLYTV